MKTDYQIIIETMRNYQSIIINVYPDNMKDELQRKWKEIDDSIEWLNEIVKFNDTYR